MRMTRKTVLLLVLAAALGRAETGGLVRVEATRLETDTFTSPYDSLAIAERAAGLPGVHLQRQGTGSPQADMRIRGGPFSGAGFILEGLPLVNPQTEHFHADLALPPLMAEPPRLVTGLDAFGYSVGHPSGGVALDLAEPDDHLAAALLAGAYGRRALSLSAGRAAPAGSALPGASLFAAHDAADRTDGQPDNHLTRWSAGALLSRPEPGREGRLLGLAAFSHKDFGARGFYGAPASLPAEERTDSALLLGLWETPLAGRPFRLSAAWQHTRDRYRLDRTDPALYENRHRTDVAALHADAAPAWNENFLVRLRADAVEESIRGDYSGRLPGAGLGHHSRGRFAAALIPEWTRGDWTWSAGGGAELHEGDGPAWLPAAGLAWEPAPGHRLFASLSGSARQPSFTELNYESPGSLGNRDLNRQETTLWEGGWRYAGAGARLEAVLFHENSRDAVDWVRAEPGARWTAVNLGRVRTTGFLAAGAVRLGDRWTIQAEYLALDKDSNDAPYASRYILDYAPHRLRAGLRVNPVAGWSLGFWQVLARHRDNPARQGTDIDLESNLELQHRSPRLSALFTLGLSNLWDDDFEPLPGQPQAGRQAYFAASFAL